MKLITQYIDPGDATDANIRLRNAGVMTTVSSLDPHIISPSKTGALRIGLWVVFDDQFDDAVRLLENPAHVPKRVITIEEMNKIESASKLSMLRSGQRLLQKTATIILGVCLLGLIAYVLIGMVNDA